MECLETLPPGPSVCCSSPVKNYRDVKEEKENNSREEEEIQRIFGGYFWIFQRFI